MKYRLLRLTMLSLLAFLFGGSALAGDNDRLWDYTENKIPTSGPDNGLYYASNVNDAPSTNMGMNGVKLNGNGWAYFQKPSVAGKLTLTFGNRKTTNAYEVNVFNGTLATDGKSVTKGTLIGTIKAEESPGSGSIELKEDVTGVVIERKTSAEGVLQKIDFKETVQRSFTDFEIPFTTLTADGYTGTGLPSGVTFSGTFHDAQHGYQNATMTVPVDGTVKFIISGCRYGGNVIVKNANNEDLATLNQKTVGCHSYDDPGDLIYIYVGDATTLTFSIPYLSYFKADATEVTEAVITYKDQNGNKLGTKTVYEGDPVGEIPYTEDDLTIPDGYKLRGWVYNSGAKVKATDVVTGNVSVNASVTAIETAPETGTIQIYDLTQATFYPEDHENFNVTNGNYHNNHGFSFNAGGSFDVAVSKKAQIVLTLCQYGSGTTFTVTDADNKTIKTDVPAKAESDGGTTAIYYTGEATTLTFTCASQFYLHKVTVFNVNDFVEKDAETGYYIVAPNDGAGLVLALNAASSETGSKIFLPNGTYNLGESVQTPISGTNVSLIGESLGGVIIKNNPPIALEGLQSASTLRNSGTGLYMQDLTLQNDLDYYAAGTGRANAFHDAGNRTVAKNVKLMSYQDTYLSSTDKQYYWEDGEIHGCVDYICGGGDVFFEGVKLVNESRKKDEKNGEATITAHQPRTAEKFGYVFNNCIIENQATKFNFGRAWGGASGATVRPTVTYLNTTLNQPSEIIATRFILKGMNNQSGIFHEYNSIDKDGNVVSPTNNEQEFTDKDGNDKNKYETILSAADAAKYTLDKVFTDWAPADLTKQVDAPTATYSEGNVTWNAVSDAKAYLIEKNDKFVAITTGTSYAITIDAANDKLTIRSANARGGFGEAKLVNGTATKINVINTTATAEDSAIYNIAGQRVSKATKGIYIIGGKKVVIK